MGYVLAMIGFLYATVGFFNMMFGWGLEPVDWLWIFVFGPGITILSLSVSHIGVRLVQDGE